MKWPLVLRSKLDAVERDNQRLRLENSTNRRIRIDLEGSNNALRGMMDEMNKQISMLRVRNG